VLPDSPPVSTVAALASIANTVVSDNQACLSFNNVPDRGSSGNSQVDVLESSGFESVSVQTCEIGMVGHLGPPRGLAIGDDDGADAGVPSWLTRLFHPPER
jgi:hypothetical protein